MEFRCGLLKPGQEYAVEAAEGVAIIEIFEGESEGQSKGAVTPRVIWLIHDRAGVAAGREPKPLLIVCQIGMRGC